jgi:heat shock protein HslJ
MLSGRLGGVAELEATAWVLDSAPGDELPADASPSAAFSAGRIAGSTGCNRFTGPYTLVGDRLELGAIAVTRMACAPPILALEQAYLEALGKVARWRIEGDALVLADENSTELLRFAAA